MRRRNRRVCLRWLLAILAMFGFAVACAPTPKADDGSPDGVRVQEFRDPRMMGKACLVFTHDTAQGASIAVVC